MNRKSGTSKDAADKLVRGIKRKTRKQYSAEEKIRIVLAGLRGEESIAALCRREGISESLYHSWSKEFLEADRLGLGCPYFHAQNLTRPSEFTPMAMMAATDTIRPPRLTYR